MNGYHRSNGKTAMPDREEVLRLSTYHAAVAGWYDTSDAAQQAELLTITAMDMAHIPGETLPANATHRFFACINATAYMVTHYRDGRYEVEEHDQTGQHQEERELRTAALDTAIWHFTGEEASDYRPGASREERTRVIAELLTEDEGEAQGEREETDPIRHPVVRDEEPDMYLAPREENSPVPYALRQWSVQIGPYYCEVGFFGYEEDGTPTLVSVDAEPPSDDYYNEENEDEGGEETEE